MLHNELDNSKEFDIIGLGEVMLRLSPPSKERISQGEVFEKKAGGSELNIVSGASLLGSRTGIITKLPKNEIGYFVKNKVRFYGVSDDYLVFDDSKYSRLGIYYYESGAYPRKSSVVYDRHDSSMVSLSLDEVDESVYSSTKIFHVSGISLGLDENLRNVIVEMIKKFKKEGALISFDVNYRASLWTEAEARVVVESILPYVDILFASEETFRKMFQRKGDLEDIIREFANTHQLRMIASTMRKVISPTRHSWYSKIFCLDSDKFYEEAPYEEIEVIDRIGSGDAYVAGVLFGIVQYEDLNKALEFGNAMSAIKNTVPGDLPSCSFESIQSVIDTHKGIGSNSEMNR